MYITCCVQSLNLYSPRFFFVFLLRSAESSRCSRTGRGLRAGSRLCSAQLSLVHRAEGSHLPPGLIYRTRLTSQSEGTHTHTLSLLYVLLCQSANFEDRHQETQHSWFLCVQFSQYLHENAAYVRPLEDAMLQLHESITEDTVTVLVQSVYALSTIVMKIRNVD